MSLSVSWMYNIYLIAFNGNDDDDERLRKTKWFAATVQKKLEMISSNTVVHTHSHTLTHSSSHKSCETCKTVSFAKWTTEWKKCNFHWNTHFTWHTFKNLAVFCLFFLVEENGMLWTHETNHDSSVFSAFLL